MRRALFDVVALITRVALGVIFVAHGWQKWQSGIGATTQGFRDMGVPMPALTAGYTTVVETLGGILMILGLLVRPVALLFLIGMLGAIVFVHAGNGVLTADNGWELPGALGALSLLFLTLGGGRIGLDGLLGAIFRRRGERRAAEEELAAHAPRTPVGGPSNVTPAAGPTAQSKEPSEPGQPAQPEQPAEPRQPSEQPHPPTSSKLNDEDMRDIDALISDEPPQHRKPPNR
ncbi:DoxX family membrane protein [Nonomuraea sp. K274]|uniref:DoxX family membrane protein n=1 Tax=Nonomuraea cypriaca TaxID=1187855 RepID=A0A931A5D5_9ACTN|nr:DoxX family protein [Nonomuraea cypriaca]MBF8186526.1 DoxX family membrane protein [Nonomuraea cypriaca]